MIEPEVREEYVRVGGVFCPFCRSGNMVSSGQLETDGCEVFQIMCCEDCGKEWKDFYVLDSVEEVENGDDPRTVSRTD